MDYPTPIFTTLFFYAPHFGRDQQLIVQNIHKSILRKRVYSFKHSGNSRGRHRGPENMRSDWQSEHEMSDLASTGVWASKFIK
jgi:hypothetical protein